jgi:hypothetical protein
MPDLPVPMRIRDWDSVTRSYDQFVFDLTKSGSICRWLEWERRVSLIIRIIFPVS